MVYRRGRYGQRGGDIATLLGLVPARGGSRGIPRKNLAVVGGDPLIAWSIRAGLAAETLDRVIVSTDDDEIAAVAAAHGAEVPFRRPAEHASDTASGAAPVIHALEWLAARGEAPEAVVLLQPTSPLRTAADIDAGVAVWRDAGSCAPAVIGVSEAKHHPYRMLRAQADGTLALYDPAGGKIARRQDMPTVYAENGAFYLWPTDRLLADGELRPPGMIPFLTPARCALDVDTPWDLAVADAVLSRPAGQS
jgi:CMP-N,N'-diacetyllegionaminic acid synthase